MNQPPNQTPPVSSAGVVAAGMFLLACFALPMWGCPRYQVYKASMEGRAKLAEAESSRQIAVQEALNKQEAAKLLAQAEIERAKGVAAANEIIGQSLNGNEDYLHYLWLQALEHGGGEVIYVPTEANLPILEAGRFGARPPPAKDP